MSWQRGSREHAADELVQLFERPLWYYIRHIVRSEDDAWDVLQEISVLRSLRTIREGRALPAFVYRTARNAALAQHRRRKEEPLGEEVADSMEDAADAPLSAEDVAAVHEGLEQLPLPQL